jgi:hypothetical protein
MKNQLKELFHEDKANRIYSIGAFNDFMSAKRFERLPEDD